MGVQAGEGLVQEHYVGVNSQSASQRYTLLATAGKVSRAIVSCLEQVGGGQCVLSALLDFCIGQLAQAQGEGHVFINAHMGPYGEGLENHAEITVFGGSIVMLFRRRKQAVAYPHLTIG